MRIRGRMEGTMMKNKRKNGGNNNENKRKNGGNNDEE